RLAAPTSTVPHAPSPARPELAEWAAPAAGTMATLLRSAQRPLPLGLGVILVLLALLLTFNVGGLRERLFAPAAPKIDSIAVLPLDNLSGDPEQEYFVDGMTEALTAELSKISALKVISRTSAMQYKGVKKPAPQIAQELGVNGLIEGSVVREGDQVRITVQLIHGPTDKHLWAESYQRELRGILALQSEVARAIARNIQVAVTPAEATRLAAARPVNPEAYQAYLKGRFHWNKRDDEGLKKSFEYFEQAIEIDPSYPLAYAGLADAYGISAALGMLPTSEALPKARAAALKALEIDQSLAEAHTSMGMVAQFGWDWSTAEKEYQRAIELNPNYATAHHFYSVYLSKMERHEEAIARARRAQELDPLSLIIGSSLAGAYSQGGQHERAEQELHKVLDMNPNFANGHNRLGRRYWERRVYDQAVVEFEKAAALNPDTPDWLGDLGHAYAAVGRRREAARILDQLKRLSQQRYVRAEAFAVVYVGLGENDRAFDWLERAYQERSCWLPFIKLNPLFDGLRSDPRYGDLLRRLNLPD
ncbi:MAG TPA: tetratricopeptide repeat protein, partial [Candidatus Acidoferrales bacterium]